MNETIENVTKKLDELGIHYELEEQLSPSEIEAVR